MIYFSCLSGSALLALLAATAPPWTVDSPAAAGHGARFGIGPGSLIERQESLRIETQQSAGVDGDPDLLNRKFDLEWEMNGPVAQVPLALSCFRLTNLIRVFPTLTLEAGSMDVSLDSIAKTEPDSDATLSGRGALFGAQLGATASLCGSCPWFSGVSYRYRSLPSFDVNLSPVFAEPGFEVLRQETSLSQEVHEVSTRVGYVVPNNRIAYYTGIRTRWTDVKVEDELRVVAGQQREMDLSTRTTLGSETVQAVAGMDARLAGSLFGNLEVAAGDGDEQVLLKVIFVPLRHSDHTTDAHQHEKIERFIGIAGFLIPQLARILAEFRGDWDKLPEIQGPDGEPTYPPAAVDELLLRNETRLLDLLGQYPELEPLADWVRDRFREARVDLDLKPPKVASLSFQLAPTRPAARSKARTDEKIEDILEPLEKIVREGKFWTRFIFKASLGPGHQIAVYPKYKWDVPDFMTTLGPGGDEDFVYGDYSFKIYHLEKGTTFRLCNARSKELGEHGSPCPLEFMNRPRFILRCSATDCTSKKWGERQ